MAVFVSPRTPIERKREVEAITLIGMPASGKSKFGKRLSNELGYKFIDPDKIIERERGTELQDLVDSLGEEKFLQLEQEKILGLGRLRRTVVAPGGSVIYLPDAMRFLSSRSVIVHLDVQFEAVEAKVRNKPDRGIIGMNGRTFRDLFLERQELFPIWADLTVDATFRDFMRMTEEIKSFMKAARR